MNVRIANTNVRTNTGKSGCVGPPLKESWSYHIRSVPIYTLRIASTDTGFDPESVSRCKLQSLSLKRYIGSHSAATTPATILSEARYPKIPYPGNSCHIGAAIPTRACHHHTGFPARWPGKANRWENCSRIRCTLLPCDLIRYAEVPFIPSLLITGKQAFRPMPDPRNTTIRGERPRSYRSGRRSRREYHHIPAGSRGRYKRLRIQRRAPPTLRPFRK